MTGPKAETVCAVAGCDRAGRSSAAGLIVCSMHWKRHRRNGHFEQTRAWSPANHEKQACAVADCETVQDGSSPYCKKHDTRARRHGDPMTVLPRPSMAGDLHPNWRGDDVDYGGMHQRVRREKGAAADFVCAGEGCNRTAAQWSYDRLDPSEKQSPLGPFSTSVDHYVPRCVPCHKRFDLAARRSS